jgi:predicted lipid-binding transport protein (Tim44 family)
MKTMKNPEYLSGPLKTMNPVMQVILALVGLGLMGGLFFLGLMFFAVFAVIALVAGTIIWLRIWWIRRKAIKAGQPDPFAMPSQASQSRDYVDAEFVVIERKSSQSQQ